MQSAAEVLDNLRGYMRDGGFVMPPLFVMTVVLWYALGLRWVRMRGVPAAAEALTAAAAGRLPEALKATELRPVLLQSVAPLRGRLVVGRSLVRSIVAVAPLAGLLGTVAGMIETFDALGDNALFAQSGGIAGGISQALLTTQMGLVVAVPGVIVGRLLDTRQGNLEREIERIRQATMLAHGVRPEVAP